MMERQETERQAVLKAMEAYGIRRDTPFETMAGGTANRNYTIRTEGQTYMLRKRNVKYSADDWIEYEEQYLLHAAEKGIPVAVPMPAANGARRSKIGKDTYQLFPFMTGERYDPCEEKELASAGAFLGSVHRAGEDFRPSIEKALPRYDDPAVITEALKRVSLERGDMAHSERQTLELMLACAERIRERLPDEAYRSLPHTIIHGDYHPANVAFREGRVCVLYDFDWISRQPRLRDIADLIVYFAALRPEPLDGGSIYSLNQGCAFDLARVEAALRAYVDNAVMPLAEEEAAALPDFMMARLLHSRVQALAKVPSERAIQVLVGAIEPALIWIERHRNAITERIR